MRCCPLFAVAIACTTTRLPSQQPDTDPALSRTQSQSQQETPVTPHRATAQETSGRADCTSELAALSATGQDGAMSTRRWLDAAQTCEAEGRSEDSRRLLGDALIRDRTEPLIHIRLARLLILQRDNQDECEAAGKVQAALAHLHRAVALDPKQATTLRSNPGFASLKNNLEFRALGSPSPTDATQIAALLDQVRLYGPGAGSFGALRELFFASDTGTTEGSVRVTSHAMDDDKALQASSHRGSWMMDGTAIRITIPAHPQWSGSYKLGPRGTLVPTDASKVMWLPSAPDCDA